MYAYNIITDIYIIHSTINNYRYLHYFVYYQLLTIHCVVANPKYKHQRGFPFDALVIIK